MYRPSRALFNGVSTRYFRFNKGGFAFLVAVFSFITKLAYHLKSEFSALFFYFIPVKRRFAVIKSSFNLKAQELLTPADSYLVPFNNRKGLLG